MAIEQTTIGETFTDDQKELIALYEKQIDNQLVKYYVEGKKFSVKPEPYPHYNWKEKISEGCDERVVGEILRKYREVGWLIEWEFNETSEIDGDWVFVFNKIKELSDFKGKNLKISFTLKFNASCVITEHELTVPVLGVCKTKVVSKIKEDQTEYVNFCIPSNLYITSVDIIKFVRYSIKDNCWTVSLQGSLVLENLKVEVI